MALIARERDGVGQRIEVPMFDAMFELIGANGISVDGDYRMSRSRGTPTYVCADGRRILFNSTSMPRFRRWFAEAAGTDTPSAELFLTRSALEWETAINAAGGPTAMIRTPSEWLADPHARARRTVVQLEDPQLGRTQMPGVQVHLSDTPGADPTASSSGRRSRCRCCSTGERSSTASDGCYWREGCRAAGGHPRPGLHPGRGRAVYRSHPGRIRRRRRQDQPGASRVTRRRLTP